MSLTLWRSEKPERSYDRCSLAWLGPYQDSEISIGVYTSRRRKRAYGLLPSLTRDEKAQNTGVQQWESSWVSLWLSWESHEVYIRHRWDWLYESLRKISQDLVPYIQDSSTWDCLMKTILFSSRFTEREHIASGHSACWLCRHTLLSLIEKNRCAQSSSQSLDRIFTNWERSLYGTVDWNRSWLRGWAMHVR